MEWRLNDLKIIDGGHTWPEVFLQIIMAIQIMILMPVMRSGNSLANMI